MDKHKLTILHVNCQGFNTAKPDLDLLINDLAPDIINLQDTRREQYNPITYAGYNNHSIHYTRGQKLGITILIKSTIPNQRIEQLPTNYPEEAITVEIKPPKSPAIRILSIYARSKQMPADFLRVELTNHKNTIIVGDLNAKHPHFHGDDTNANGQALFNLYQEQLVNSVNPGLPTRHPQTQGHRSSSIDFILGTTTTFPLLSNFLVQDPIESDHQPITADIKLTAAIPQAQYKPKPMFDKADWNEYKSFIRERVNTLPIIQANQQSIDQSITAITNIIQAADTKAVPRTSNKSRQPYPQEIINKIKAKRKIRRNYIANRDPAIKTIINRLQKEIRNEIRDFKQDQTTNTWNAVNNKEPGAFWTTVRKLIKQPSLPSMQPLQFEGSTHHTPDEQVKVFHKLYQDIHSIPPPRPGSEELNTQVEQFVQGRLRPNNPAASRITELNCNVTPADILHAVKRTKNTSPGHDEIYHSHLKNLPLEALRYLANLYEICIRTQYFPTTWKKGITILLPKPKKDHTDPKNYRPITLLPTLGKTLERIFNSRLTLHLEENGKINPYQAGYRKNRCTTDTITRLIQEASHRINMGHCTFAAFYDVEKAFDKVWHDGLLFKLKTKSHLSDGVIKFIQSFLMNRTTHFRIGSTMSDQLTIPAGTPQGSVLSPTLFTLWVNDLPPPEHGTDLGQYADDLSTWASHRCYVTARDRLQDYNDKIETWSDLWRSTYNATKTQCILFSKKAPSNPNACYITVKNTKVYAVKFAKALGVTMDNKLTFRHHFEEIHKKVKSRIPLLKLIAGNHNLTKAQPNITLSVYNTMIRPLMEYAPTALIMFTESQFNLLEKQRIKAYKIAYHLPNYINKEYIIDDMDQNSPKTRIQKLARKYIERQPPGSSLFHLIQQARTATQARRFGPLHKTPIGRTLTAM